jgi:hypothetical protein
MDALDSKLNLDFTYHFDKYSCIRQMYFIHLFFSYVVSISGFCAILSRLINRYRHTHVWFGRTYILSMLWCSATAMLIHNTGLPLAVLISFLWVLIGLTFGWITIIFHQDKINRKTIENSNKHLQRLLNGDVYDLEHLIYSEKMAIARNKTSLERFFSLKALHGILMVSSWMSIVGRLFFSNQSGDFTCHTYPVYKQVEFPQYGGQFYKNLTFVPIHDPNFDKLPWSFSPVLWSVMVIGSSVVMSAVVGAGWSVLRI